jgi:holliday junction DNA helicase RuvA
LIARLTGKLVDSRSNRGIIDVNGVGYEIFATQRDLSAWTDEDTVIVSVSTQVREDSIHLYGFASEDKRLAFEVLLSVSGVGPKVALATLDTFSTSELAQAVETDDIRALNQIAGVGKKTAQRLALELKGKLAVSFEPNARARTKIKIPADPLPLALARLGYTKSEIDTALHALQSQGISREADVSERLRAALRALSAT